MALIEWRNEFDTGVAEVDHEHQELVELINALHDQLQGGADADRHRRRSWARCSPRSRPTSRSRRR